MDKRAFFASLDALDEDDDSTESELETTLSPVEANKRRKLSRSNILPVVQTADKSGGSCRTAGTKPSIKAPEIARKEPPAHISSRADCDQRLSRYKSLTKSHSTPAETVTNLDKKDERKKADKLGGIFSGCIFYFVPNDDVAKVRRLRQQNAVVQGAVRSHKLDSKVTHILVQINVEAKELLRYLEKQMVSKIDFDQIHILKDSWLVESLNHKFMYETTWTRHQIAGFKDVLYPASKVRVQPDPLVLQKGSVPLPRSSIVLDRQSKRVYTPAGLLTVDMGKKAPPNEPSKLAQIVGIQSIENEKDNFNHPNDDADLDQYLLDASDYEVDRQMVKISENKWFACMDSSSNPGVDNPNAGIIDILQKMATHYDQTGDNWRTLAYRKAIGVLRKQKTLIKTKEEAEALFQVGSSIAEKIEEIATTQRLRKLDEREADPKDRILQLFMGIYGVGYQQANLWISQGHSTLEDLRSKAQLTTNQQIGIEHYDDFRARICRAEIEQHGAIVQNALHEIHLDLVGIIGGSYRRGNSDSGDIDLIITHPTASLEQLRIWVLDELVPNLFKSGFLKCSLAASRRPLAASTKHNHNPKKRDFDAPVTAPPGVGTIDQGTKFHGASCLSSSTTWRRIDFLLAPHESLGAALIYFTGNDIFNRSMRLLASKKGMRLNQWGLYKDVMRGTGRVKITQGEMIAGCEGRQGEKKIFEVLGVPWREPQERKC